MSPSLFSRGDGEDEVPAEPKEGVRLIGADEAAEAVEKGAAAKRLGEDEPRYGDRPEAPAADVTPALRFPLAEDEEPAEIERPKPAPVPPRATGEQPVLSVGPPTGETELLPWTAPATGEVPKVVSADVEADDADDDAAWTAYAAGGPRWRDHNTDWDASVPADDFSDLADAEVAPAGALDTTARPTQEEFLSFDDLEVPEADLPRAPARGSAEDPIRIGLDRAAATPGTPNPPEGRAARPTAKKVAVRKRAAAPAAPDEAGGAPARRPAAATSSGGRDMQTAVVVGLGLVAIGIVCFVVGPIALVPLIAVILLVSAGEFFASTRRAGLHPLTPLGLAAVVGLVLATWAKGEAGIPVVLFLALLVATVWYVVGLARDRPLLNVGTTFFGIVYVGVLGSFASLILKIGPVGGETSDQGRWILFLAVVSAVVYDALGYVLGSRYGRTTFTSISPNKTLEGLAIGCIGSVIAVVLFGLFLGPFSFGQLVVFGILCAFAAPLGDLFESLLKRDIGIKDTSNVLPGHGGVLDRFDALLFVLPTAFYLTRILLSL